MRSPYLEVSFCDLNTQTVEQTVVEVNPFYRFFDIFSEILDINQKGYEKTREIFVDTVFHYLALTDLRMGMSKKDYYLKFLAEELESGQFGSKAKAAMRLFSRYEKRYLVLALMDVVASRNYLEIFKWLFQEIYINSMSYGNKKIIGASMKGNVTAVKKDTVKVVLMEDKTGGWAGQKWFAYSTIYSSPDGTGWYCMPEKGDSVRLYFPNENEAEAYVNSSVNEQSSNSSARSNPDEKSIKNKQGKEVLFQPDRLILTNNNGMSVKIIDDEGIIIESDKSITIRAKENIGIISMEQGVEMSAPEKIAFQQGSTMLELADDINVQGGRVNMQ